MIDAPRRRTLAVGRGALLLLLAACSSPPALEVGPVAYSPDEVRLLSEDQRGLLTDITAFGVLTAEDRLAEAREPFIERELHSIMLQRLAMEVAVEEAGMDEQELREAYSRSPEPELVVRHLVVLSERWRPEEHRDSARAVAEEALERARAGESFESLAGEYSDEPGAADRGGLLEPGRRDSWVPEFWAAATDLREGELSPVVETEFGFHVLRLEERRAIPFEDVRHEVLERFVDLPAALSRAQEWTVSESASLSVDTAAIRAWMAGAAEPADTLATWRAGSGLASFTVGDLSAYHATLGPASRPGSPPADLETALMQVESAARSRLLAERARQRGLEPSAAQRAALERSWTTRLENLAGTLGFRTGMRAGAVKESSLEALGGGGQALAIARSELRRLSPVLRLAVPVSLPGAPTP